MTVIAVLQARMSSSRLPGKVLKEILGRPMLVYQIERVKRCRRIDKLIVATSDLPEDAAIESLCTALGVVCYRGSLNDVLDRFVQAARPLHPTHLVRLTGDCPLVSPAIIDNVIQLHLQEGADYTSNCFPATLPDGLDVEVVRWPVLETAWREADEPLHREHVTSYVRDRMEGIRQAVYRHSPDYSGLRLTVDYPEDFELVAKVIAALYPAKPEFDLDDMIELLAGRPEWLAANHLHQRNGEYLKALSHAATK